MLLKELGLEAGWLLLSTSEMKDLKASMDGAMKEIERLNKQTARLVSDKIALNAVLSAIASQVISVEKVQDQLVEVVHIVKRQAEHTTPEMDAGQLIETLGKLFCGEKPQPNKSKS
jgi:hypothetical protein